MAEQLVINSFSPVGSGRALYEVSTNQGEFYYRPSEYITKGVRVGDTQYFNPQLLQEDVLKTGQPVTLDPSVIQNQPILNYGYETPETGVLFPKSQHQSVVDAGVNYYSLGERGGIGGVANIDGSNKYLIEGGSGNQYSFINPTGNITNRTVTIKQSGGALGKVVRSIAGAFGDIPLLTEATLLIPGAGPMIYGALKGAQLGMSGKSPLEAGLQVGATVAAPQIGAAILPESIATIPGTTTAAGTTVAGLLSGQTPAQALTTGAAAGVGSAVGGEVAQSTGSQAAGQLAGGTTAGLLAGKGSETAVLGALVNTLGTQTGNLVNREVYGGGNMEDSFWNDLYAADAAQLAAQGIGQQQIADILQFSGADPFVAYDAANLASQGLSAADIFRNLSQTTAGTTTGGAAGGLASTATRSLLQRLLGGGGAGATGTRAGVPAGGDTGVAGLLSSILGDNLLGRVAGAGIDYAAQQKIIDELRKAGASASQQYRTIGQEAQVPFTPYTVTTGLGTAAVGPGTATTTAAAPYQAIQQQALQRAQQTLGAINPAQATQTLFSQLENLQAPERARQQEALLSKLGARGLLGYGQNLPITGGAMGTVNPYMESLLSAQASQQAQNALAAQQFGTQEAGRQQALAQAFTTQGAGIDEATRQLLATTGTLGEQERARALQNAVNLANASSTGLGTQLGYEALAQRGDLAQINQLAQLGRGLFGAPLTGTTEQQRQQQNQIGSLYGIVPRALQEIFG